MRCALLGLVVTTFACSKTAADVQADGCPNDLLAAQGKACDSNGKTCSGGSEVRMIMCSKGQWVELNVPPMPRPPPPEH
jgi:hypothetical protein